MIAMDFSDLVQTIIDLFTVFLVTIPSKFISEAIDGGVLYTLWTTLFDNPKILQMLLIFALIGGGYVMARNWHKKPSGGSKL